MLFLTEVSAVLPVVLDAPMAGAGFCVPGFCPLPSAGGPPPGLMFLALGLIAVGVRGLARGRGAGS